MYKLVQHLAHIWSKTWPDFGKLLDLIFYQKLVRFWVIFWPNIWPDVGWFWTWCCTKVGHIFASCFIELDWIWGPDFTNCVVRFWIIVVPDFSCVRICSWYGNMKIYDDDIWWYMMLRYDIWWYMMIYDVTWWYMMIYNDIWWYRDDMMIVLW